MQKTISPIKMNAQPTLSFRDLEFMHLPVTAYSSRGTPFKKLVPVGMPRIPQNMLNCVCYLYSNEEQARAGKEFGGTAFLVAIPSKTSNNLYIYAITNAHVACTGGASVLRINTKDGGSDIFPYEPHDWDFDPKYDIAVICLGLNSEIHKFAAVDLHGLLTQESMIKARIGIGEDVFMVGRFVDHDGGAINRPAARFGNISVMPSPIEQPNGVMADAFCIDLHSRAGYSGSPVFVYRTPGYDLEEELPTDLKDANILLAGRNLLTLLGIHFSQFPEQWEIVAEMSGKVSEASSVPIVKGGSYIKGLSGMTCVLPAWCITEVLNSPKNAARRAMSDARLLHEMANNCNSVPEPE